VAGLSCGGEVDKETLGQKEVFLDMPGPGHSLQFGHERSTAAPVEASNESDVANREPVDERSSAKTRAKEERASTKPSSTAWPPAEILCRVEQALFPNLLIVSVEVPDENDCGQNGDGKEKKKRKFQGALLDITNG